MLTNLLAELRQLITEGNDPSLRRLFPPTYPDDDELQAEYAALAHDELLDKRLAGIEIVEHTLGEEVLDEEQLSDWMRAINELPGWCSAPSST
ncbi:MAG: DUF2017 family protein [Acidimicrobiia bacterium]|nr:DUF2017 family protein [Acidimicrobiia bacterium]